MTPNSQPSKILAVVADLFFGAKIREAAKQAGATIEFVPGEDALWEKASARPSLIILDLNHAAVDPVALIAKLKADPERQQASILGFVSHVQAGLIDRAQAAGCDLVLARSAFSANLPEILGRYTG